MNKRKKEISEMLRRTFPAQPTHEIQLCKKIVSQLPERKTKLLHLLINYFLFAIVCLVIIITHWDSMKEIIQKVIYNPLSDTEGVLSLTCCIIIFITVIWQIYSLLDEYRSMENRDFIEMVIKQK